MSYKPGDTFWKIFPTTDEVGMAVVPDAAPTGKLYKNGTHDAAVTVTVTNIETGLYSATCTIPGSYSPGDVIEVVAFIATSLGTAKQPVDVAVLDKRVNDIVNSANKVSPADASIAAATFAAGAIDAAAIATDAVGANEFSAAAVAKIWDALLSGMNATGSVGLLLVNNIENMTTGLQGVGELVALVKQDTDRIPDDPASNTQVNTRLATSGYTAPDNATIATAAADALLARKILQADVTIDKTTTPWELVYTERGTSSELFRQRLRDVDSGNIAATTTVIGRATQS